MSYMKEFIRYFEEDWKDEEVMSTEDFIIIFPNIHRNLIRHYLNKMVEMGIIFMIKESHKTMWYIKSIHYEDFLPFKYLNEKMTDNFVNKKKD